MRWKGGRRSTNIEDRRGSGGFGLPIGRGGLGCGTLVIALVAALIFGVDPAQLLALLGGGDPAPEQQTAPGDRPTDEAADFVSVVLASTEDTWGTIFAEQGGRYQPPQLVLYNDMVQSACGISSAATGPFYCPGDAKVYLDLGFLRELQRMGASGDFAVAYVIAHEVGHHVQRLTGTEEQVRRMQQQVGRGDANALSVRMELQADCYAGVWANYADREQQLLEEGDIEEGINAAAAVGDDRLQRSAGQAVQPDAFTHGSSEQRVQWFRTGLQTGSLQACDTFADLRN